MSERLSECTWAGGRAACLSECDYVWLSESDYVWLSESDYVWLSECDYVWLSECDYVWLSIILICGNFKIPILWNDEISLYHKIKKYIILVYKLFFFKVFLSFLLIQTNKQTSCYIQSKKH